MLSDDRFLELLQDVEGAGRPDPVFLDRLFDDLLRQRGSRTSRKAGFMFSRPIVRYGSVVLGLLAVALVVVILRPGGSPVVPPNGTSAPTASPTPTVSPSPTPSASPSASASVSASPPGSSPTASAGSAGLPLGPLAPGTYDNAAGAPFTFTAEAGWQVYGDTPTYLQLADADDPTSSLWFAQAFGVDDAAAAVRLWTGQGIVASAKSVTIGGVKGTQFTAVAPKDTVMFGLASDGSDSYGLVKGAAARVFVADIGGTVVTVIVETSDPDALAAFLPKADKLLKTVAFSS